MNHGRTLLVGAMLTVLALLMASCGDDGGTPAGGADAASPGNTDQADCAPARPAEPGTERMTLEHDGETREFDLTVPEGYDGSGAAPLVVDMHGFTATIEDQTLLSDMPEAAGERGYLVATPQALPTPLPVGDGGEFIFWNVTPVTDGGEAEVEGGLDAADDLGFIEAMVSSIERDLCVDGDRVYAAGMSNGGGMAVTLACSTSDRYAAVAPVASVNMTTSCPATTPIATIAFHGDDDPLVAYEGGVVADFELGNPGVQDRMAELAALGGCDAEPTTTEPFDDVVVDVWPNCEPGIDVELYTVLDGGHTWPGVTTYRSEDELAPDDDDDALADDSGEAVAAAGHQTTNIVATDLALDFFDAHPWG